MITFWERVAELQFCGMDNVSSRAEKFYSVRTLGKASVDELIDENQYTLAHLKSSTS